MNRLADLKQPLNEWSQVSEKCYEPTQSGSKEIPDIAARFRDDRIIVAAAGGFRGDGIIVAAAGFRGDGIIVAAAR